MYESSGSSEVVCIEPLSAASLRAQAQRCRRHAVSLDDEMATTALNALAVEYESKAAELERH